MHFFHVSTTSRAIASNWSCHSRRIIFNSYLVKYSVRFIFASLLVSFNAAPLPSFHTAPPFAPKLLDPPERASFNYINSQAAYDVTDEALVEHQAAAGRSARQQVE